MEIPEEILHGNPGIYTITYQGQEYKVLIGNITPGSTVGVTVHGGGAGNRGDVHGYITTYDEQRTLLNGQTIDEAIESNNTTVNSQNQIDVFPTSHFGHYKGNGSQISADLASDIITGIDNNLGNSSIYMPKGYSASARSALDSAIKYAQSHSDTIQIPVLEIEPSGEQYRIYTNDEIQFIKEHNITITQVRSNAMLSDYNQNIKNGFPLIDVELVIIDENGNKVKATPSNGQWGMLHTIPNSIMGDFNYSGLSNGTFSFSNLFSQDVTYEYNGRTYTIDAVVKLYNIEGFENGTEISLEDYDYLMSMLVMSDEAYFTSEIDNIKLAFQKLKSVVAESTSLGFSSTTKIPSSIPEIINKTIELNARLITEIANTVSKMENAREDYNALDEELMNKAIYELNQYELLTQPVVKDDTPIPVVEKNKPSHKESSKKGGNNNG